jgi:hypothetical protein
MSTEQHPITREMCLVHTAFRREFGLLPALIRGAGGGDVERAGIIADHYALVRGVLDHHHHGEDTGQWPLLLSRSPQDAGPVVRAMLSQHGELDTILAEVTAGMAGWRETADPEQGAAVAGAAGRLSRVLSEHLAAEEEQALPLMEQHITEAEWNQQVADGAANATPDQRLLFLGMMIYEGDPDAIGQVIEHMPPDIRPVIAGQATEAFARHCQRVYGTPAPAKIGALR